MTRFAPLLGPLILAGCLTPDPNPLAWTATYSRNYEAMTSCLSQRTPVEYQVVPAIDQRQKVVLKHQHSRAGVIENVH